MSDLPQEREPSRQPDIEHEPHLRHTNFVSDLTESLAAGRLAREQARDSAADRVEHTVWDEPALSSELAGEPGDGELTYRRWLTANIASTPIAKTWLVTLLVALAAGPWGVLGAMFSSGGSSFSVMLYSVFGPVTEEVTKIAAALWVVEKRPFLFCSKLQVLLCAVCGGLAFAAIENLLYLYVYVPKHSMVFVQWRWKVCVGLHAGCSFVAGIGLARIWDNSIRLQQRPKLALGVPWFVIAMAGHGLYNFAVSVAQAAGWLDFLQAE